MAKKFLEKVVEIENLRLGDKQGDKQVFFLFRKKKLQLVTYKFLSKRASVNR